MSASVVSTLRARPGIVRLAPDPASDSISVRVQIPEVWDVLSISAAPSTSVLEVKRRAISELLPDDSAAQEFVVKLRGYEVLDESVTLAQAGIRNGSTLLVTSRRRRPVR